ncbi:uncharacterized protein LOC114127113 [Aphis gossypii]|uniref:uncharacterized protein LOC114127113 n=1 Tax=Aphis gossypii TaxID=80765 RepID=UPI0021593F86|nr:uncharacterized protein LOC114127113 [Aphis gossypii]
MSKENDVVDHLCDKQINCINEDEPCKKSLLDTSNSSENINCANKLNSTNADEKNNFKTSTMLTSTDDNKLIGINNDHDSNQLNKEECKFMIEKIKFNEADLNSQDANVLEELLKKNGHNLCTNSQGLDINTQQFMELNYCKAVQRLHAFSPKLNLDSPETFTIKQIDLDNSIVISTPPLINELRNSEIKDKNSIIINDSKKSEKFNHHSPKIIDLELPIQDQYAEFPVEDQDAEIIAFRGMCEAMLRIGSIDNNTIDDNKIIVKKNNEMNNLNVKQINHNVNCLNSMEYEPSTSKLDVGVNDYSKHLKRKKHQINNLRFDSSDDSSSEYSSSQQYFKSKKSKCTFFYNSLKINSKHYSVTNNRIVIQPKNAKKIKLSDIKCQDKEIDCMLIENPLPKVQNLKINNLKRKKINDNSLEQNKLLKENQTIFYFSSTGKVHNDMLNYIENKKSQSM